MEYFLNLIVLVLIYAIMVGSLDLLIGYTGILSFGPAAFTGIGAYATALVATKLGLGFAGSLAIALAVTAAIALIVAIPTLKMKDEYFLLATFAVGAVTLSVLENWHDFTRGPFGIHGIPRASLFGLQASSTLSYLVLVAVFATVFLWAKRRLINSPFGIALRAIREDQTVALVVGKNVKAAQVTIFVIGCAGTGLGGALLAHYLRFIDPTLFVLNFTIFLWAALFVGGCASIAGNIAGPAVLILFPESLRFLGLSGSAVPHVQQALYGTLLVLITLLRPQGLFGTYRIR